MSLAQKVTVLRKATGGSVGTGWMHDEVCWLLHGLIRFHRPSLVIQTGHLWGKSALVVLDALEEAPLDGGEMGDSSYAQFVEENRPPKVEGKLISIDPDPLGVSMPAAGVALLEKWYPDSFRFVDKASAQFFEHFDVG